MKRRISLVCMSLLYLFAGCNHFIHPAFYLKIMPPYMPVPLELVYLSGIAEVLLGALLLMQKTRLLACWLIVAMLIVFLTVHIQMIVDHSNFRDPVFYVALLRLPLQFVLIRWAYKLRNTQWNYQP